MLIDNLNLNLVRVFEAVCRTGSMTKAASELHLTQSGVSQNIKNLEEMLGFPLFDRVKGRPLVTPKGKELFNLVSTQLQQLEGKLASLKGEELSLKGELKMGIPIEYGNTFVLPLAAKFGALHPRVHFQFFYGHASEVNQMLLSGDLDMAIVDSFGVDPQIETLEVDYETHTLCASTSYLEKFKGFKEKDEKKLLKQIHYISYLKAAPILKSWFTHHYPKIHFEGHIRATLMDVQGVGQLILNGLGAGILPLHLVKKYKKRGVTLHLFDGKGEPLKNILSLAIAKGRTRSPVVEGFIELLKQDLESR